MLNERNYAQGLKLKEVPVAQVVSVPCTGVNNIGAALNAIQPGQEIRYGANFSGREVGLSNAEYEFIVQKVEALESADRIMRFHNDGFYVARGTEPAAKRQLEDWARTGAYKL